MSEFKLNMGWIFRFYGPLKRRLILLALQSVAVAALSAIIPFFYIRIIDGIQNDISSEFILKSVLLLLVLGILRFVVSVTNATRRAKTNIELEWQFRQKTFERLISLDQSFYTRFRTGDIVTRLTDDVGRKLSWFACSGIFRAWESILRIVFYLVAMILINPWLALFALIPYPFQILIFLKSVRILDTRFKSLQSVISRVNETIETCFSGIKIIQAYSAENRHARKFADVAGERADAEITAEKAHIFVHLLYGYFWQIAQVIVLIAGGWMVINNKLTLGQFIAFNYYVLDLVWPMFDIGGLLTGYSRAAVSIRRLRELDDFTPLITSPVSPVKPEQVTGRIQFENVSFRHGDKTILDNVSFDTDGHRLIAVVGEIGSGKSSLLNLICRFFDPNTGKITLNNIPLDQIDLSDLRHSIGYVSQEPLLFTDSVINNIRFGREWITDASITNAADIAQLTSEVNGFNQGFDTPIGLRGMTVSGGQKQRISIARALAGNPAILVLDDATAHLDAGTEEALWQRISQTLPDMKTVLTSHRTSTLEQADLILVLQNGALVESGNHEALIAGKNVYHRIYSRQKLREAVGENVLPG